MNFSLAKTTKYLRLHLLDPERNRPALDQIHERLCAGDVIDPAAGLLRGDDLMVGVGGLHGGGSDVI